MTDQIFYTEGAGNTFFFTLSDHLKFKDLFDCAKQKALMPDGFIVSKRVTETLVTFDFYNNDGSSVDFCGNALRAVGVCYNKISGVQRFVLKTKVGNLKISLKGVEENKPKGEVRTGTLVEAQMPAPLAQGLVEIRGIEVPHILSGVPHLVFDQEKFGLKTQKDVKAFCKEVRRMSLGGLESYNLSFYEKGTAPVKCVTFERGVEDFTKACGSGALSVAFVVGGEEVNLEMPGGLLKVSQKNSETFMLGPAKIIETY